MLYMRAGHVIFEIACGYELTEIAPGEGQYKDVKDERVKEILRLIFRTDQEGAFTSTIEQVRGQGSVWVVDYLHILQ